LTREKFRSIEEHHEEVFWKPTENEHLR
jgi:hypothetical protein